MAAYNIPAPKPLDLSSENLAEKWKLWKVTWHNYELATKVSQEEEEIRVATLLAVIGEDYPIRNWIESPTEHAHVAFVFATVLA